MKVLFLAVFFTSIIFLIIDILWLSYSVKNFYRPNLGSLLNDKSIEDSVIRGSASAAIVVTKVGCAPAMPFQNEIEEFMKLNKLSKLKN